MPDRQQAGFQIEPIEGVELLLDRVAGALREAILNGDLAPGARLSVPEIARQLNVSRTPAREALMRLQHEGLVSVTPRHGAVVLSEQTGDLDEIFQYREALEGMAARLAARQMSEDQRSTLRAEFDAHAEAVRAGDLSQHVAHDRKFHRLIAVGSGNERIATELDRLLSQLTLLTRKMSSAPGAMDDRIIAAHRKIIESIEARDGAAAEDAARFHVRAIRAFYRELNVPVSVSGKGA
ncbi:GntR family transcriptional regulator [soil metagenome]